MRLSERERECFSERVRFRESFRELDKDIGERVFQREKMRLIS